MYEPFVFRERSEDDIGSLLDDKPVDDDRLTLWVPVHAADELRVLLCRPQSVLYFVSVDRLSCGQELRTTMIITLAKSRLSPTLPT